MPTPPHHREPPHEHASSLDSAPLGEHPLVDGARPDLRRMQASLRQRMFGGPAPTLGRFTVLERLGHGGMGVVHAAHDPRLDRRVAIKVLRPGSTATGKRLVREAQALARLSHPNVVTIYEVGYDVGYDVGDREGEVFLVMELLGGGTLREWLCAQRRSWPEVLDMVLAAGHGLAAAHALGLVHRDFKPENVLLGDDGRPRVVDFGLTRAEPEHMATEERPRPSSLEGGGAELASTVSRFGGTPGYMAPEQSEGHPTARSDQYSFCVVLHEALLGRRPEPAARPDTTSARRVVDGRLPAAVLRALRRGLSPDPRARFEDMPALLAALERARDGRPWGWIVGSSLTGVAVSVAVSATDPSSLPAATAEPESGPCAEARRLVESTRPSETSAKPGELEARLHGYLDAASAEIEGACQGEGAEARAPGALACVRRRVLQAQALVGFHADGTLPTPQALDVARQLPALHVCADPARLASEPDPPADPELAAAEQSLRDEIERTRVLRVGGAHVQARARLEAVLASARTLPSPAAQAEAELELARLLAIEGRTDDAIAGLREAIVTAERAGHSRSRAWAQIELGGELGRRGDFEAADDELDRAEATVERIGGPDGLPAKLVEVRGIVALMARRDDEAVERLERAIALHEADRGPDAFVLVGPVNLLGVALAQSGRAEQARVQLERARDLVLRHYGPEHPLLGRVLNNLGQAMRDSGDLVRTREVLEQALALNERNLGPDHPSVPMARDNLARVLLWLDEPEEAERHAQVAFAAAERIHGPTSPELRFFLATLARTSAIAGRMQEALDRLERAEAVITAAWGEHAVQHLDIADAWLDVLALARPDALAARRARVERILHEHQVSAPPELAAALAKVGP